MIATILALLLSSPPETTKPCKFVASPSTLNNSSEEVINQIVVLTSHNCSWKVTSNTPFIKVISPSTGKGSGSFFYKVEKNKSVLPRQGNLIIEENNDNR